MKFSVYTKLIACYIIIFVTPFITIQMIGSFHLRTEITNDYKSSLYQEANYIAKGLLSNYDGDPVSFINEKNQIKIAEERLKTTILIVNKEGDIIISTHRQDPNKETLNLNEWNSTLLSNTFSENIIIPDYINESSLFISVPFTDKIGMRGYLLMATPMSNIEERYSSYLLSLQFLFIPLSIVSLIVFFLIYLFLVYPLNKIIKATKNYASGNYDYTFTLRSNDEFQTLSKTLTYMAGEMNKLDDYRKNFIANISHDFRSPLTSIKGYVEAMLDGTIPTENRDKYLNTILFETERLTKLTENLLELNGFENKRIGFDITTFDINATIKKTVESFEGVCMNRHIQLQLDFSEDEVIVDADIGKIQQVLYNLLDNAVKFSHNDTYIKVSSSTKGEKAFISIKDYGIGIPNESLIHIWDRFYKIDASRGKDKKGTGLGLSIAREIIHAHGENINVISTEGVGSEFVFSLPLH